MAYWESMVRALWAWSPNTLGRLGEVVRGPGEVQGRWEGLRERDIGERGWGTGEKGFGG